MALQKTIQITGTSIITDGTVSIPGADQTVDFDAYVKVESISGTKNALMVKMVFSNGTASFERNYGFTPAMDGPNFIKQAYQFLKTLPEFSNAVDC